MHPHCCKCHYFKNTCMCACFHFSCVRLFVTPWPVSRQAPLSVGFSRQEYWSRLPCPPLGDLPDPGMEPASLTSPALAGCFFFLPLVPLENSNFFKVISNLQKNLQVLGWPNSSFEFFHKLLLWEDLSELFGQPIIMSV